jgi:hypothetical protein
VIVHLAGEMRRKQTLSVQPSVVFPLNHLSTSKAPAAPDPRSAEPGDRAFGTSYEKAVASELVLEFSSRRAPNGSNP